MYVGHFYLISSAVSRIAQSSSPSYFCDFFFFLTKSSTCILTNIAPYSYVIVHQFTMTLPLQVEFKVTYTMNLGKYNGQVVISSAILCVLGCILAGIQTWGWSKRGGKTAIDFLTLIKWALYSVNCLANIFFIIALGTSCWWIVFYKVQCMHVFYPGGIICKIFDCLCARHMGVIVWEDICLQRIQTKIKIKKWGSKAIKKYSKINFSLAVKLLSGECYRTSLIRSGCAAPWKVLEF